MTLQDVYTAIEAAIPRHGMIVLNHSMHNNQDFYSGYVTEPTNVDESKYTTPDMARVVQCYKIEDLLEGLLQSFAAYVPDRVARIELLHKQLAELEQLAA